MWNMQIIQSPLIEINLFKMWMHYKKIEATIIQDRRGGVIEERSNL